MKITTQTDILRSNFSDTETVDILKEAGFDNIDFSFFSQRDYDVNIDKEEFKKKFTELRKYAEDKGMHFTQAHAPFSSSYADEAKTELRFREIVSAMRNASYLGIKHIVVHPCQHLSYIEGNNAEILYQYNMDFYSRLMPYAEEFNIVVCTENMWQNYAARKIWVSTCATPEEFNRYIDGMNSPYLRGCLDLGHTILVGQNPADFIRKMGADRLVALHVHDVNGIEDSHTLPYYGIIRWDEVTCALKDIGYRGEITLEADSFIRNIPKDLMPTAEKLMAQTARRLAEASC